MYFQTKHMPVVFIFISLVSSNASNVSDRHLRMRFLTPRKTQSCYRRLPGNIPENPFTMIKKLQTFTVFLCGDFLLSDDAKLDEHDLQGRFKRRLCS